jgi:hypothetical protein
VTTKRKLSVLRRTPDEKLRGLVNLKILDKGFYTQKELGAMLGISERTIRRFKNQKGYTLAPRTLARIAPGLSREDRKVKRLIDSGTVLKVRTVTIRGKRRRVVEQMKDLSLKAPPSRILQLPVIYTAKSGESQTIKTDVRGWGTDQKIEFLESAHAEKRFGSWHARVMVPPGVARSGRKGEGEIVPEDDEIDEETGDEMPAAPEYYMIGPFELKRNLAKARTEIVYHEDAGRVIVEIYLVEKLKRKKGKK